MVLLPCWNYFSYFFGAAAMLELFLIDEFGEV